MEQEAFFFTRGRKFVIKCKFLEPCDSKNPYLLGHFVKDEQKRAVYWGKDGLKVHPPDLTIFLHLVSHIKEQPAENGIFVDANTRGYSLVLVLDGKAELFSFRLSFASSQKNELQALLFGVKIARWLNLPVLSDSLFAIEKVREKVSSVDIQKVKAHEGIFWNTVADRICSLSQETFTAISEDFLWCEG